MFLEQFLLPILTYWKMSRNAAQKKLEKTLGHINRPNLFIKYSITANTVVNFSFITGLTSQSPSKGITKNLESHWHGLRTLRQFARQPLLIMSPDITASYF